MVNLTIPAAHAEVAEQAIAAGKHVWNEKPLALDLRQCARALLDAAEAAGLRVGCAPDTFLGSGLQATFRQLACGVDRATADRAVLDAAARTGPVAPQSGVPVPGRRRSGVRHRPVLPDRARADVRPGRPVAAVDSKSRETRVIRGRARRRVRSSPSRCRRQTATLVKFAQRPVAHHVAELRLRGAADPARGHRERRERCCCPIPTCSTGTSRSGAMGAEEWEVAEKTTALSSRGTGVLDMARAIRADRPHRAQGRFGLPRARRSWWRSPNPAGVASSYGWRAPSSRLRAAARRLGSEGRNRLTTTVQLLGFVALARSADGADPTNRSRFRRGAARSRSGR